MQGDVTAGAALTAAAAAALLSIACLTRRTSSRRRRARALAALALAVVAVTLSAISGQLQAVAAAADAPLAAAADALTDAPTWTPVAVHRGPGYRGIARLRFPTFPTALRDVATGDAAARLPSRGEVGSVVIPATVSRFAARPAIVYLPPAALVPRPRLLPVVIAFSGQSRGAGPRDLVAKGGLAATMDRIAATHHGVAPIVVVPDQLGPASANPMCVDSRALGHAATYVLHDVRDWILTHLPVETGRRAWTVAGFSEGGTCSIQFAAAHPGIFGSVVDVSGENAPTNGTRAHTIEVGFGGDTDAYVRGTPAWLLAHHRYPDEQAYFAAGALDEDYGPVAPVMAARARAAGMAVRLRIFPGLHHNWTVGGAGLAWGLDHLTRRWGI